MGISITFNTGSSSITLTTPTVVYGTDFFDNRYNQTSIRTCDGELITYGTGLSIVNGEIVMKGVDWTEGDNFRTWLHNEAVFSMNKFTITPPSQLDLGKGKGRSITSVNFVGEDDKGVFKLVVPGVFNITFPYTFVRTINENIKGTASIELISTGIL